MPGGVIRIVRERERECVRNAQNYIRDSDGKVIVLHRPSAGTRPTSPTVPTTDLDLPAQPPTISLDLGTKAQTAAAADHERRQQNNPYHLPPHLRPPDAAASAPQAHHHSQGATKQIKTMHRTQDPKPTPTTLPDDVELPRGGRPPQHREVRFHLPDDHREHPPKPTRYRTALRKLEDSTSTQLQIDGVMHNPVIVVENRPAYMIPEIAHPDPRTPAHPNQPEHGEPLFFQPPVLRQGARASSSTEPPRNSSESGESIFAASPSHICDLEEEADLAVVEGNAPSWQTSGTDGDELMQTTLRVGANTQDVSWIWGAAPSTLPPTFPLDPNNILCMRGTAAGAWRGVVEQPRPGQTVYHPRRLRHEPTVVIFNTFGTYKDTAGTLPTGTRLTITPVGEWMSTTRIGLAAARTPRLWLVVVDEMNSQAPQQGRLPLAAGESFWLVWSQDGIWARKPRFQDDVAQLGGASIFPPTSPPRPPTPPERRGGYMPNHTRTNQQQPRRRPAQAMPKPQAALLPLRTTGQPEQATASRVQVSGPSHETGGQGRQTSRPDTPGQPRRPNLPSPGSESETSWPSDDHEDYDNSGLMQTGGRASSSTDPMPITNNANSHDLLDNLDNILQTLLQQSFLQPREEVTDLAYRACSRLLALRKLLTGDPDPPPFETVPDEDRSAPINPLAEAQVMLRQLVLQHNEMTKGQLRSTLRQVQAILGRTRRVIDLQGRSLIPHTGMRH